MVILGQILAFLAHLFPCPTKNNAKKVTRCFSVMWVLKLLLSPVQIRIFCPKRTQFCPKIAFLVILGQALLAHLVPCWWVGWWLWRAGCISQDTYLLYAVATIGPLFPERYMKKKALCEKSMKCFYKCMEFEQKEKGV